MIKLHAEASALTVTEGLDDTALVSTMANVASVQVTFSEDWDDLDKVLVFTDGIRTIIHELEADDEVVPVPHELLAEPGRTLYIGVQGTDGERVILPTVMCRLKAVAWGADPDGDTTTVPSKVHWIEVRDELERLETSAAASEASASASASDAEAWAIGRRGGQPVPADPDPAVPSSANSSLYWASQAMATAQRVTAAAVGAWLDAHPEALSDAVVLEKISQYATVADMQADESLAAGQIVVTLGTAERGDGGGCPYVIRNAPQTGEWNVLLQNGLCAVLIPPAGHVTPEMFGPTYSVDTPTKAAATSETLQACVDYAIAKGKEIRIDRDVVFSESIETGRPVEGNPDDVRGRNLTITSSKTLKYTGTDYAVRIQAPRQKFTAHRIWAPNGGGIAIDTSIYHVEYVETDVRFMDCAKSCYRNVTENGHHVTYTKAAGELWQTGAEGGYPVIDVEVGELGKYIGECVFEGMNLNAAQCGALVVGGKESYPDLRGMSAVRFHDVSVEGLSGIGFVIDTATSTDIIDPRYGELQANHTVVKLIGKVNGLTFRGNYILRIDRIDMTDMTQSGTVLRFDVPICDSGNNQIAQGLHMRGARRWFVLPRLTSKVVTSIPQSGIVEIGPYTTRGYVQTIRFSSTANANATVKLSPYHDPASYPYLTFVVYNKAYTITDSEGNELATISGATGTYLLFLDGYQNVVVKKP